MQKVTIVLSLVIFTVYCSSAAVVKQKLKDQIREQELQEQQKLKVPNLDNDEEATTVRVADPPIQHQFASVVQSGVGQVEAEDEAPAPEVQENKPDEPTGAEKEAEEEEDESDKSVVKPSVRPTQKSRVPTTEKVAEEEKEEVEEEEKKVESTEGPESGDDEDEDEDEATVRKAKRKLQLPNKKLLRQNTDCGYYRLKPGEVFPILSQNFNDGNESISESCTWKFFGHHCVIKASCPCFNLPESLDCSRDYLKLTDIFSFSERFCGERKPEGLYKSTTNNLVIRYKSEANTTTKEPFVNKTVVCTVTCTGPGRPDPIVKPLNCSK